MKHLRLAERSEHVAPLRRDGVSPYYEIHGTGSAILLTHGFSATSQMWRGHIEPSAKDYRLIFWDTRGHSRRRALPDWRSRPREVVIRDVRRAPKIDQPDAFNASVSKFLESLPE